MTNARKLALLILVVVFLTITALLTPPPGPRPAELEAPLTKLTSAVVGVIRYGSPAAKALPDDLLLREAMKNDPALQQTFARCVVRLRHDSRDAVLLVCSPDGKQAWLEDRSWTPGIDGRPYLDAQSGPPVFTMGLRGGGGAAAAEGGASAAPNAAVSKP